MRKIISITLVLIATLCSVAAKEPVKVGVTAVNSTKVEVFYFHYTRRCVTCNAVENETKTAIQALYPAQYKKGEITFKSVNLDEKGSEALAKKCKAEGQALLIISKTKRLDLTDKGFMYAKTSPDKLKAALKKDIDPLL